LKSLRLKEAAEDQKKLPLLEKQIQSLKKEKASLECKVELLKDVIQRNRGNYLFQLGSSMVE